MKAHYYFTSAWYLKGIISLGLTLSTKAVFSQTNTLPVTGNVGIGTTSPSQKLTVNGSARIDSTLVVKDSVRINKNLRVDQDVRFLGETKMKDVKVTDEFIVNGLSKLNGDIKFTNVPLAANYTELNFLIMNQNGMVKKGSGDEFVEALKSIIYAPPHPGTPLTICDLVGYTPTWVNGSNTLYVACPNVNVGIGTTTPAFSLDVAGSSKISGHLWTQLSLSVGADNNPFSKFNLVNTTRTAAIQANTVGNTKPYQRLLFFEYDNPDTKIMEVINTATGRTPFTLKADGAMDIDNGVTNILHLGTDGMFSISNNTRKTFVVEASGLTRARKIKVDAEVWADYVFEENYQLMPLADVEIFLKEHKHLPSIPSEKVLKEEGIDVAEMNVKMMEKIEELTLYLIQQNKELVKMKGELETLKQQKP